jgi:NADP-dependent 3-hydroxy acid dehydrogenase YdfG
MPSKVWFVNGASKGFVESTLRRGDKIAATSLETAPLSRLKARYGDNLLTMRVDPDDAGAVEAAIARARERFGRLDVMFGNPQPSRNPA